MFNGRAVTSSVQTVTRQSLFKLKLFKMIMQYFVVITGIMHFESDLLGVYMLVSFRLISQDRRGDIQMT